jgi:hypothetical protein
MRKLVALTILVVAAGVGLALWFGPFAGSGGGNKYGEPFVLSVYAEPVGGGWSCDDIREIVNPRGVERYPPVVAVVEAHDVGMRVDATNRYLVSHMVARAKGGHPFADEEEALKDIEDGYILYIAAVRDGLGVSEGQARARLEDQPRGSCEVSAEGITEEQLARTMQVALTNARLVRQIVDTSVQLGADADQMIAARIAQERPTVKITEVAFGAAGGLECTEGGVKVDCPPDLPTPQATPTP